MDLTISIDEELLRRAQQQALLRGTTLQDLLREHLRSLVGDPSSESTAEELIGLMTAEGGHSGGREITRQEAYEDRVVGSLHVENPSRTQAEE